MNEYDELLTGASKPKNEYDAIVQDQAGNQNTVLRGSMRAASSMDPDQAAKVVKLSERLKLPTSVVERNFDSLSKKYDLSDSEYESLIRENPKLSSWLTDSANAAVARDDLPIMKRIENTFASFGRGWSKASTQGELADLLFKEVDSGIGPVERARRDKLKGDIKYMSEQDAGNGVPEYIASVTGYSARQMGTSLMVAGQGAGTGGAVGALAGAPIGGVGAAPGFVAGATAGALTASANYSYRMETGFAFDQFRDMRDVNDNPIPLDVAKNAARAVGVVNAVIESGSDVLLASLVPGFSKLTAGLGGEAAKRAVQQAAMDALKVPTRRAALMSAIGKMGGAGSIEGLEEFVQNLVTAGGREVAQGASGQTFKPDDITDDIRKASGEALDAAVGTFFTFAPVGGARFYQLHRQAQKAQEQEQFFLALGRGVQESKTFERLPEKMQDFINTTTKDGPVDKVYVPVEQWSTYWQNKGVDPARAAESVGVTTMYESAVQSGADIMIPMSTFATKIAPTEHGAFFASEARLAPDEMNAREAKELEATLAKEQQKADAETKAAQQAKVQAQDTDAVMTKLKDDIKAKLIAAGVEQRTAEDYAAAQEARFRQFADRAGISSEALFERFVKGDKLQVGSGETHGEGAQMMSQRARLTAVPSAGSRDDGQLQNLELRNAQGRVGEAQIHRTTYGDTPAWSIAFMGLDKEHQMRGLGLHAVDAVIEQIRTVDPQATHVTAEVMSQNIARLMIHRLGQPEMVSDDIREYTVDEALEKLPKLTPVEKDGISPAAGNRIFMAWPMPEQLDQSAIEETINVDGQDRPTTNSKGQPIAQTAEALQNFWRWFGDSKVVDAQGRPLVVYHGSPKAGFNEFQPNKKSKVEGSYFFTSKLPVAATYSGTQKEAIIDEVFGEETGPGVYSAYLKIDKPHEFYFDGANWDGQKDPHFDLINEDGDAFDSVYTIAEAQDAVDSGKAESYEAVDTLFTSTDAEVRAAIRMGDDGAVLRDVVDEGDKAGGYGEPSDIFVVFKPTQIKSAVGNLGTFDPLSASILNQPAYHGSPHNFDKFSTDAIGTGEGAQSYGWGLYFAENEDVASGYHSRLAGNPSIIELKLGSMRIGQHNGLNYSKRDSESDVENIRASLAEDLLIDETKLLAHKGDIQQYVLNVLDDRIKNYYDPKTDPQMIVAAKKLYSMLDRPDSISIKHEESQGGVYKVDIDDKVVARMLDWDAKISAQPEAVRSALERIVAAGKSADAEGAARLKADAVADVGDLANAMFVGGAVAEHISRDSTGEQLYEAMVTALDGDNRVASSMLSAVGIPGNKYSDADSRTLSWKVYDAKGNVLGAFDNQGQADKHAASQPKNIKTKIEYEGTRNLVVFDDKDVTITHKDGTPVTAEERKQYFQPPEQDSKRGSITFTNGQNRKFKIDLLEGADLSTFIHESGHFWLEVMGDLVQELRVGPAEKLNEKQRKMVEDYDALLKWMGVASRADIKVEQHEQFARAIESYFMEGKSPSPALQNLFARVRSWMLAIYQSLSKLNVSLTPEVREVFDRMLASDQEIEAAQAEANVVPLFADDKTLLEAGFTPEFVAAYRDKVQKASDSAKQQLTEKVMRAVTREREKWWKEQRAAVREDVAAEVNARQEQIALSVLTRDVMPNGDPLPYDMQRIKMSRAEVDAMYGEAAWKTLPRGSTATDGLPLQAVADLFGYGSGDALVKAIRQAKPANAVIEAETDSRMKETHGDMLVDGTIHAAAQEAVQNEERMAVVQAELRALAKMRAAAAPAVALERSQAKQARSQGVQALRGAVPPLAAVRQMAAGRIALTRVSDLTPNTYLVAARRASQSAVEAAAKGDYEVALSAKQREMMNIELFKASTAAREEVDKTVAYMQAFGEGKKRARMAKAGQDYLDQIDGFLDRYDFAQVSQKALDRRKNLAVWVAQKEAAGEPVNLPDDVVVETRTNYKDMTVEELRGVRDSVKHIEHLAKLKNRLLTAKKKATLDEVVEEIETSIRDNATSYKGVKIESRLPTDEALRAIDSFFAMHRKLSSWLRQLDGLKDGGVLWEYIMRPINEAADREATMNAKAIKKLADLFSVYKDKDQRALYERQAIPEIGTSLTKMARIMAALNWGNDDNRQKLMDGYGWTQVQVEAVLAGLDERDWKFVQGVWDYIDSYWSLIEAKEKRINGIAPEKVERSPVLTRFGEVAGGYFPLKYDDRQSAQAHGNRVKDIAEQQMKGGYTKATTRRGHTKERVSNVKLPIRLDFGVIDEHVSQVIHDVTHHEMLIDVNRLLGNKTVSGAAIEVYGDIVYKQIQGAIVDIAAGNIPAVGAFEKSINYARTGTTIVGLGWSMMTSLLQPLGLFQSMVRIGPKWVGKGIARWIGDAAQFENTARWIREKSEFMANRGRTQQREINEIRNEIGINTGKLSGWVDQILRTTTLDTVNRQAVADSYFWLIQKAQQVADIPTWIGAYEKAMADPANDEARAIALADQAVLDSQGGGQMKDLAAIQRGGPLLKIWTNFYSYFNVTYNQSVESIKRTKFSNPIHLGRFAVDFLLLYTLPATLGTLMKSALKGDDDDPEKLAEKLIRENLSYMTGMMVGLREAGSAIQGYSGYEGPAGTRFFSSIAKLIKQSEQGETDAAFWKALNDVAGILLHYPAGQVRRTAEGLAALIEGDTKNPASLLFGAPKQ